MSVCLCLSLFWFSFGLDVISEVGLGGGQEAALENWRVTEPLGSETLSPKKWGHSGPVALTAGDFPRAVDSGAEHNTDGSGRGLA